MRDANATGETVIEVRDLRKVYQHFVAVDAISFEVRRGEIFGLLGSNGAGKTTTVECVQGLRTPTSGTVRMLGHDPKTEAGALRGRVGCQLQESRLPDHLKVWEAVDLFASFTPGAADPDVLLEAVGSRRQARRHVCQPLRGQRQRLFIALALLSGPEVVFLDEMTTGLDPAARRVAWGLIEQVRDGGATVVLVTHFMDEAERLCDRVAVMDAGKIVALDAPRRLVARYDPLEEVVFTCDRDDLEWLLRVPGARSYERRGRRVVLYGTGPLLALRRRRARRTRHRARRPARPRAVARGRLPQAHRPSGGGLTVGALLKLTWVEAQALPARADDARVHLRLPRRDPLRHGRDLRRAGGRPARSHVPRLQAARLLRPRLHGPGDGLGRRDHAAGAPDRVPGRRRLAALSRLARPRLGGARLADARRQRPRRHRRGPGLGLRRVRLRAPRSGVAAARWS